MTRRGLLALGLPLLAATSLIGVTAAGADRKPVAFTDARLKVEINATDGDAGLQIFLDGEAWKAVQLFRPDGEMVLDVDVTGPVEDYGLTELFSESSEPPFAIFPLDDFRDLFPPGEYTFSGTTIGDRAMTGTATLTHDFPDGPEIVSPIDGARVPRDETVVEWEPVTTPAGIQIAGYQVLVVDEDPLRVFSADLPATARRLPIPAEFLEARNEYKVEVLAIEVGGNQTLTELTFTAA